MFYDAIKAKYPDIQIISTMRTRDREFVHSRKPDLLDDHFYVTIPTALAQAHLYDDYSRSATKVFVGEWAVNLIGYDALTSFGSPSYYVQKMFSTNRGDLVLPASFDPVPKLTLEEI